MVCKKNKKWRSDEESRDLDITCLATNPHILLMLKAQVCKITLRLDWWPPSKQAWSLSARIYLCLAFRPHTSVRSGSQLGRSLQMCRALHARQSEQRGALSLPVSCKLTPSKNSKVVGGKLIWESVNPGSAGSSRKVESKVQDGSLMPLFLSRLEWSTRATISSLKKTSDAVR